MSDAEFVLPMWEDAKVVAAFARWHPAATAYYRPASEALLAAASVGPGMRLLDIGTGTGIPALQAAELVGSAGQVVATDPSAGFLAVAEGNARAAGASNVVFERAAAEALPFPDASFDAAVSQLGLMFVTDLPRALGEVRRVLRPGGKAAFLTWAPYVENPNWSAFWTIEERYAAELRTADEGESETAPEAGEPNPFNPFRFAELGTLAAALEAAGFAAPREEVLRVALPLPGPEPIAAFWWEGNATYEALPPERQQAFRDEVLAAYGAFAVDAGIAVPAVFVLGTGTAP